MSLETALDKLHIRVTDNRFLQLFTVFTRILLAIGFIPPSLIKIVNRPFTVLPDSDPVGHYFNALYQTGFYYQFIGWVQLIAALLLLFPPTAHLGALMFFGIILNIAVLTFSVGFQGTVYITALMLLAATYLVCWEYDRLKPLVFIGRKKKSKNDIYEFLWLPVVGAAGSVGMACFLAYYGVANLDRQFMPFLIFSIFAGLVFGLACAIHHRYMKTGKLSYSEDTID